MGAVPEQHLAAQPGTGMRHLIGVMADQVEVRVAPLEEKCRLPVTCIGVRKRHPAIRSPLRRVELLRFNSPGEACHAWPLSPRIVNAILLGARHLSTTPEGDRMDIPNI